MALFYVVRDAAFVFIVIGMLTTLVSDTIFSVYATQTFLLPITRTIDTAQGQGQGQSRALTSLQLTKHLTLAGASLAVISSTLLYANLIMAVIVRGIFITSPWLNPLVLACNLDSICNDVGLLLMSGILKRIAHWPLLKAASTWFVSAILKTRGMPAVKIAPIDPDPPCFESMREQREELWVGVTPLPA
jgi:hypothetical protein